MHKISRNLGSCIANIGFLVQRSAVFPWNLKTQDLIDFLIYCLYKPNCQMFWLTWDICIYGILKIICLISHFDVRVSSLLSPTTIIFYVNEHSLNINNIKISTRVLVLLTNIIDKLFFLFLFIQLFVFFEMHAFKLPSIIYDNDLFDYLWTNMLV